MSLLQKEVLLNKSYQTDQFSELTLVEESLRTTLAGSQGIIKETATNLSSGGKRLRPLLTVQSGLCFGPINRDMIDTAVAAELIHIASLIHDDVIDKSSTRRFQATVNTVHGNHVAVLTGDYVFAEAFSILATRQILPSIAYLTTAIKEMCQGEVDQADHNFTYIAEEKYIRHIGKKTATLLAACCKSGAATAGADSTEISLMGEYGSYLGHAYQIVDDILDLVGDPLLVGKPTGLDLANGHLTLPIIFLMDNPVYSAWLKELIETHQITPNGLESIKAALHKTGCLDKAYLVAKNYVALALAALDTIPTSSSKTTLLNLGANVLTRLN